MELSEKQVKKWRALKTSTRVYMTKTIDAALSFVLAIFIGVTVFVFLLLR
jgi:hypothetical protein